jgi:hypothetical protein
MKITLLCTLQRTHTQIWFTYMQIKYVLVLRSVFS